MILLLLLAKVWNFITPISDIAIVAYEGMELYYCNQRYYYCCLRRYGIILLQPAILLLLLAKVWNYITPTSDITIVACEGMEL